MIWNLSVVGDLAADSADWQLHGKKKDPDQMGVVDSSIGQGVFLVGVQGGNVLIELSLVAYREDMPTWARVDQLLVLGMGNLQPLIGNPYNGAL